MEKKSTSPTIKKVLKHPLFFIGFALFLLANSSSHPTSNGGYTGAPGDGVCSQCHGGNNPSFNGTISIDGVPSTIMTGQTYQITVTVSNPNGNANEAGFQIVALTSSNTNAGNMTNPSASSVVKTSATKKYFGHSPSVPFTGSNDLTWTVDWTAPASGTGDITFYGGAILANGTGSSSGDKFVTTNTSGTLSGGTMALSATLSNVTNVSCFNGNDGSATANAVGGTGGYTYLWNNGESGQTATSLPSGLARVTVTDNAGTTTTAQATITQPTAITINVNSQTNPTCFNSGNGSISVAASGGSGGFLYDWSNGLTGASISGLNPGTYTVSATDVNDCVQTRSITLTAPPAIVINSANVVNQKCQGQNNGSISITASGGTGTLLYDWSNGGSGTSISNLAPGSYTVSISDANNCELTQNYTINPAVAIALPVPTSTSPTCFGGNNGTATANPTGGAGGFTYVWSTGASTKTANNLSAGTYIVTVTDANQCTKSNQVVVTEPVAITNTATVTNASCLGVPNGSATVIPVGGTSPYTAVWSTGASGLTLSNVVAGTYQITITDSKSCTAASSVTISANTSATLALANSVSPTCFGGANGSLSITATNAAGFSVTWSNGASGNTLSNIPAGTYTAIASNPNGCQSNTLELTLTQPTQISASSELVKNISCFGLTDGSITTTYGGGTGTLSYLWNTTATTSSIADLAKGSYTLSITDANNCQVSKSYAIVEPALLKIDSSKITNALCFGNNGTATIYPSGGTGTLNTTWSNNATGNVITALAGTYYSTTSDANGCTYIDSVTIASPTIIADGATIVNETIQGSNNGSITTNATGGTGSLSYLWSNDSTTASITNLAAGPYTLTITDGNGCSRTFAYNVQIGGCALTATSTVTNVSCFGGNDGSIAIEVANGTGPYTYNAPTTSLSAGQYTIQVLDAIGCTITLSDIIITQPTAIAIEVDTVIAATAAVNSNGSIGISVTGGVGGYIYEWKNAAGTVVSNVQDPGSLLPGDYIVTVRDTNDCAFISDSIKVGFTTATVQVWEDQFKIYPNPALNTINITSPYAGAKIDVIDEQGKRVVSFVQRQTAEQVDLSNFKAGLYLMKISIADKVFVKTFLKQ